MLSVSIGQSFVVECRTKMKQRAMLERLEQLDVTINVGGSVQKMFVPPEQKRAGAGGTGQLGIHLFV